MKGKVSIDVSIELGNIGSVYSDKGNYPEALKYYK
jgi:hypothetical protein